MEKYQDSKQEQSILKPGHYDDLTGLSDMTLFFELGEAAKTCVLKGGGQPILLYFNLDGMKFFNANYGFAQGDRILQAFAGLLLRNFGTENCCRIGADHFAAVSEETGLEDKLNGIFYEFGCLNDGKTPPVHVGIYPYHMEDVPISFACDRAKLACNTAGETYSSGFRYYNAALREEAILRQYIVENIDSAIREKWIQVYLQPIVRAVNEQVCDTEALARWIDPEKGVLYPSIFIPALENAGLIYKLDLYIVEQVVELIKTQIAEGFFVVPHSINLSRSDFEACDIVEEIRKRVDEAGISRGFITIELTESVIGRDFEFMKKQVERFRDLGFCVWMDDFGSGYSSLDLLQSIRFDLIKFDLSFMKKFDEGNKGKAILTELMKMVTSLDMDTVCEGVETDEQVRFLQEIGCSKLQGFYYSKPLPYDVIREKSDEKTLIAHENPVETDYYERIGRVNLYDLGVVGNDEENAFQNVWSTLPIAILEIREDRGRYIRSNRSFRDFVKRFSDVEILRGSIDFSDPGILYGTTFVSVMRQCCTNGNRTFFTEKLPDGSAVYFFAQRIGTNPATRSTAVVIAVLSVTKSEEVTTYADIAKALAADYYNIFVIDLDTDEYIEYSSRIGGEELAVERHGTDFFESAKRDTKTRIYEEDREPFLSLFTKENVLRDLERQGLFTTTYRLIDTGTPMYVNMKITRMSGGNRIILGVSIIDARMKQLEEEKKLRQERLSLGRVAALSPNYIVLYTVDLETDHYTQYSPSREFETFGLARQGEDFFTDVRLDAPKAIAPEDMERHLLVLTKENILRVIRENGFFIHNYRLIIDGKRVPVSLRASLVREDDGEKIILGVTNDEGEYRRQLEEAYKTASINATIYNHIAHALARGFTNLYYVNIRTNELIEFHTDNERGVLSEARRGMDFFEGCERDARVVLYPEDQEKFIRAMNREFLSGALAETGEYELTYRIMKDGAPLYVQMKVSQMEDDADIIVIAVSDIDELMRQRRLEERIQEERVIYARLQAITGNFIVVYVVDPETNHYREFSSTVDYEEKIARDKTGTDFFRAVCKDACVFTHPNDRKQFLSVFTKENVMEEIRKNGIFTWGYRILMEGRPIHVQMKAAMVEEKDGLRLIVGLNDIDAQVRQEEEFTKRLALARSQVNVDALTGVKNKHAYLEEEARLNHRIAEQHQEPFAVVILDINDLKKVNDTSGHHAGDRYICAACKIICDIFKHSPVFRIGGDEFAVIARGYDYTSIQERIGEISRHNKKALRSGDVVIACGMARYDRDVCVADVFERADQRMYENKKMLKAEN